MSRTLAPAEARALAESFAGERLFEVDAANETPPLIAFVVQIKNGSQVRQQFEAMGTSSMSVSLQHDGLCDHDAGEYVNVRRRDPERDAWGEQNNRRAMALQLARPDDLTRACTGDL